LKRQGAQRLLPSNGKALFRQLRANLTFFFTGARENNPPAPYQKSKYNTKSFHFFPPFSFILIKREGKEGETLSKGIKESPAWVQWKKKEL
jgi:hypothetical protein